MKSEIENLKAKLRILEEDQKKELKIKQDAFKFKVVLTAKKENESDFFRRLPDCFRNLEITLHFENWEEAAKLNLSSEDGVMKYYFLEGFIVSLGGGTCLLDTPCKATEVEWQELCKGNIPEKFLRDWVKEFLK